MKTTHQGPCPKCSQERTAPSESFGSEFYCDSCGDVLASQASEAPRMAVAQDFETPQRERDRIEAEWLSITTEVEDLRSRLAEATKALAKPESIEEQVRAELVNRIDERQPPKYSLAPRRFEPSGSAASIRVENITKNYALGKAAIPVLKGVSLTIEAGEMVALMGSSGSGKTTLINLLGTLDHATAGECWIDGEALSCLPESDRALVRNRKIGFVFQNFNLLLRLTALENVMLPLAYSPRNLSERECREKAKILLERMGLGDRLDHRPSQLSGGQQQRVAIARALVNDCSLLIADEPTGNLDSKTSEDVLALFQRLNAEDGLTIVLVTHDPWVASHANRVIHIRDGVLVESDETTAGDSQRNGHSHVLPEPISLPPEPLPESDPHAALLNAPRPIAKQASSNQRRSTLLFFYRTLRMALHSLRRNALRSALTTLGIVIGVASIIIIAEIGRGSTSTIKQILQTTGANNLLIQAGAASRNGISLGSGTIKTLTPEDADAILRECPAVVSAAPIVYTRQQVVYGNRNWVPIYIYGTTPSFLTVREWEDLPQGEPFTAHDVQDASLVCLIGNTLADELFPNESPVGKEVQVNGVPLKVLGVLSPKGANIIGDDQDDILLAPWTTIRFRVSGTSSAAANVEPVIKDAAPLDSSARRFPRTQVDLYPTSSANQRANTPQLARFSNVDSVLAHAATMEDVPLAMEQIKKLLRERHSITPVQTDDFNVHEFTEIVRAVQATMGLIASLLLCAALISLVVGGVGIMNIMLVSVTERFREIGLRMAVGASPSDILQQFLIESVVLSVFGGAVGILIGRSGSLMIRELAHWPTESSLVAVIGSVAVSVTVGVIFGYYPAWKASCLNPIEALRYE
jgi:macrolide transport system ATP-binding/permease protein